MLDLETAGLHIIQIDEPVSREGLPLRRADWGSYLSWAITCFRIASAGVCDETQIHTHMCYEEFNDIIEAIGNMGADELAIESSHSGLELLGALVEYRYPKDIGPGIYDVHSPCIPSRKELEETLRRILLLVPAEQLWVNPDCGLKTRRWEEIRPALTHLIEAARTARATLGASFTGQEVK